MSGAGAAGAYGKHPGQADFLRAGAGEFAQAGLDRWFEDATEGLRRERLALPAGATAFLLSAEGERAFAGAFAPSGDAVGRTFPMVLFAPLAASTGLPDLHGQGTSFAEAAAALLAETPALSPADFSARAQALRVGESFGGDTIPLAGESTGTLVAALGGAPGVLAYAVRTCISACEQAAKAAGGPSSTSTSASAAITIDAPAPSGAARAFWVELVAQRLQGKVRPSLLWTDGSAGRVLMALGGTPPPPALLAYLANPQHRASRFWPLRTDSTAAIATAMQALTPDQRRAIDEPATSLDVLLAAFAAP
jgi:type VI secretion system ImpM family protein